MPVVRTIHIETSPEYRFVATNANGNRTVLQAHPPASDDQASMGLGPMEALLAALGSCTAVDVIDIMRKKRTPLDHYRVEVIGIRAETTPARYTSITVRHIARGSGVTADNLAKAARLSHEKYCSVAASLHPDIAWTIEGVVE
jgi:putative redox protein